MLKKVLVGSSLSGLSGLALAEVPAGVTAGITEAVADVGVIGAAVMLVVIAIAGYRWIKKPING